MNLLNRKKTYTINTKITQNIVRRSINCLNKKKTNKYHSHCKSSKYSIEKMELDELKAAKKIQTPVVHNQAKTPSSLLAKTKTAASTFLNKFSSNQPTTPSSIKSKIPESVKSASTLKPILKTGFNTPTTTRPIVSRTPSTVHTFQTTKSRFNNNTINEKRLVSRVTKPATDNTYKTPAKMESNINLRKNISRTVDCAKTAIRRSIRRLNSPPTKLAQTPNLQKKTLYASSSSKIPTASAKRDLSKTEGNPQRTVNLTRNVNTELRSIKRQSLLARRSSLGLNEDSLIFVTPRQIRRLFESASKVNTENKIEEEEEIKIQSVKPSSLLKYLIKDRHAEKVKNLQENIIEEAVQPEVINTVSEDNVLKSGESKVSAMPVQIEENTEAKCSDFDIIQELQSTKADELQSIEITSTNELKESKNIHEQIQEQIMEVEVNQKVDTIENNDCKEIQENIITNVENEINQDIQEQIMEVETEVNQNMENIENNECKETQENIVNNAEIQEQISEVETEVNNIVEIIDNNKSKEDVVTVTNVENESKQIETMTTEQVQVIETMQIEENFEQINTEAVIEDVKIDNQMKLEDTVQSEINSNEEKPEEVFIIEEVLESVQVEEEIKTIERGSSNENDKIETNIPIENPATEFEANTSFSNKEKKVIDLLADNQVKIANTEENEQKDLISVESFSADQIKENIEISNDIEQNNVETSQKIENAATAETASNLVEETTSNIETPNMSESASTEQVTEENVNISKSEEENYNIECNQEIEHSIATNAETQCSFVDEIPNNEDKQEINMTDSEQQAEKETEEENYNIECNQEIEHSIATNAETQCSFVDEIPNNEDIQEINNIESKSEEQTIEKELDEQNNKKIEDPVEIQKETKVLNTKRKRKQPLDEINHENEALKVAEPTVVEPNEEEAGVKKRKYTRKNNKAEIQPEIIEKKIEEVEPPQVVVEEPIKAKRTYKKRAAAAPVDQEPSSKVQKENTEPIVNERVLTRAQRAKLNHK